MAFAKKVAPAIEKAIPCQRIGVAVLGLEVPHAHIHLIPLNSMADMDFNHKLKPTQEELAKTAEKIRRSCEIWFVFNERGPVIRSDSRAAFVEREINASIR